MRVVGVLGTKKEQIKEGIRKTRPDLYGAFGCNRDNFANSLLLTRKMHDKKYLRYKQKNILAHKMSISFHPEDNDKLTYEEADKIAGKFAHKFFWNKEYEAMWAVHTDTDTARGIYNVCFPHAERNVMKRQLVINTLSFELHTEVYDGYGDKEMADRLFTIDRKRRILTMTDFQTDGGEQSVTVDGGQMAKLLRYIGHTLEIFMWEQDYCLTSVFVKPVLKHSCVRFRIRVLLIWKWITTAQVEFF